MWELDFNVKSGVRGDGFAKNGVKKANCKKK
jgi:hypothetical protein